ncbi:MAG: type II secretion system F family protein [Chloroflexi bacterium]|nr:type II secretion system F family protein [Chloroflexota bacterium]MCI0578890.1 type II secretion system F family protein [Chloroflexota bacterium]MCI0649131.1 type II secretion system F family protein [Chloroflexota bacterium]MCI0727046.1 type II secretion system F family protein [Chloroflexota bacterium]
MLILAGGVAAFLLIAASIVLLRRAEEDPLSTRIDEYAAREEPVPIEEIELSLPITDRIFVPILRRLSNFVVRFTPQTALERTAHQLELAGSPRNMSAAEFLVLRGAITVFLGILFFFVVGEYAAEPAKRLLYALIVAALGFFLPQMYLTSMIRRRKDAIIKKFPDALDLMSICVDAGLTFDGAMSKVDEKWDDPLAREFGRVIHEMQLGKSRRQSLRDMTDRMEVADVASFVAAILQADQLGVSIGKVLRIQSEQMRIRRRQRAEEKAHQAPVKMLFPMVFLIFPSMFIVLLGPAMFQVLRNEAVQRVFG